MAATLKASVITCTYNRCESLRATLASLASLQTTAGLAWELIVVDNNSTDGTCDVVRSFAGEQSFPVVYVLERSQGLSFARNAGLARARGEFIIFTDDDVLVDPQWLARIVQVFEGTGCAAVGGKIVPTWTCPRPDWFANSGKFRLEGAIISFDRGEATKAMRSRPVGANMAFRRDVFTRHGLFRTDLGRQGKSLLGGEDTEFCSRLIAAGECVMYAADAVVHHPVAPERVRKKYFERWYFQFGRAAVKMEGIPNGAVCYWGVPRYLVRSFLSNVARWWFSLGTVPRFYYKLQACSDVGTIVETWQRHKELRRPCC